MSMANTWRSPFVCEFMGNELWKLFPFSMFAFSLFKLMLIHSHTLFSLKKSPFGSSEENNFYFFFDVIERKMRQNGEKLETHFDSRIQSIVRIVEDRWQFFKVGGACTIYFLYEVPSSEKKRTAISSFLHKTQLWKVFKTLILSYWNRENEEKFLKIFMAQFLLEEIFKENFLRDVCTLQFYDNLFCF